MVKCLRSHNNVLFDEDVMSFLSNIVFVIFLNYFFMFEKYLNFRKKIKNSWPHFLNKINALQWRV